MSQAEHKAFIVTMTVVPLVAFLAAIPLAAEFGLVSWLDIAILVVGYSICALGLSAGYHRLLTHRSYKTYKPIRAILAVMGSMAAEGPPIVWVSHHRRHHSLADKEGDPHSPHLHGQEGWRGALKGLWHAHIGWLFDHDLTSNPMRYAPDLIRERQMRQISKYFVPIVVASLIIPFAIGLLATGTLRGGFTAFLWGGLVRVFLVHHFTYAVNSVGHVSGARPFSTSDESRNVTWLAVPSFGEAWHNNHHAFPTSARHGLRWWQIDLSGLTIAAMQKVGLAWGVVEISEERQQKKAREPGDRSDLHSTSVR